MLGFGWVFFWFCFFVVVVVVLFFCFLGGLVGWVFAVLTYCLFLGGIHTAAHGKNWGSFKGMLCITLTPSLHSSRSGATS